MNPVRRWVRDTVVRVGRVATNDLANRLASHDAEQRRVLQMLESRTAVADPAASGRGGLHRATIAAQYLRGHGLEIGALHRPLQLPDGAVADYCDKETLATLVGWYPEVSGIQAPDMIDDGEHLSSVADGTYDFVVANHFLEHAEDPFGTLKTFRRVLRPGGRMFMAIPDKRWTFDRDRALTDLDHLLVDHREGPAGSRRGHYEEWLSVVKGVTGDALAPEIERHLAERVNIHFHVWTIREMSEMFFAARDVLGIPIEVKLMFADPPMLEAIWVLELV